MDRRLIVSVSYASAIPLPRDCAVHRRRSDWGAGKAKKAVLVLLDSLALARQARHFETLVVLTAGVELFLICLLVRKPRIVAVDWLIPRSPRFDRVRVLRRVARFVVVRSGDMPTLARRFGVDSRNCVFAPLPAPRSTGSVTDDGYYYSAGWAHRDWHTLARALTLVPVPAVLATDASPGVPSTVSLVGAQSPERGRELMRASRCVVLAMEDTELPSGPLVLLDAMAHGKPVIVTDVRGSRDYVRPGVDVLTVPPADPESLAAAIRRVEEDPGLRVSLGANALQTVRSYTADRFWAIGLDTT